VAEQRVGRSRACGWAGHLGPAKHRRLPGGRAWLPRVVGCIEEKRRVAWCLLRTLVESIPEMRPGVARHSASDRQDSVKLS